MASQVFTDPIILDSTGQQIAAAIEALAPSNVAVDISTSLSASGWTNSSPYTQTWLNNKVSDECGIKVEFLAGAVNNDVLYLEYEKVPGGVKFTAPKKPSTDIPVVVHIINAKAESITSISGDMVSTDVVSGAGNVDEALEVHNEAIANLSNYIRIIEFEMPSSVTLTAGQDSDTTYANVNVSSAIPSGYKLIGCYNRTTGNQNFINRYVYATSSITIAAAYRNVGSSTESGTPTINIIVIRDI